jgi:transposase InsO family protein
MERDSHTGSAALAGRGAPGAAAPPKRQRIGLSTVPAQRLRAEHPNHVWAMNFLFDTTVDGRPFKVLSMCDEFTRESTGGSVGRSITANDVITILDSAYL